MQRKFVPGSLVQGTPLSNLLSIRDGQVRHNAIVRYVEWRNVDGERVGAGDLSRNDLHAFVREMPATELLFLVEIPENAETTPDRMSLTAMLWGSVYVISALGTLEVTDIKDQRSAAISRLESLLAVYTTGRG